jgi:hypothetical protein
MMGRCPLRFGNYVNFPIMYKYFSNTSIISISLTFWAFYKLEEVYNLLNHDLNVGSRGTTLKTKLQSLDDN